MQIPKINIQNVKTNLQNTGKQAWRTLQNANEGFDTFIKNKTKLDPKTVKQVGLGTAVTAIGLTLAGLCIKGIAKQIKEKIDEK